MSTSITLSHLGWSTPDGRSLFEDLDLSFGLERCGIVGRNGVGKSTLLRLIAGELTPRAGRITVNGTVGMLRQIVDVGTDETIADLFGVRAALALLTRAEAGKADADELAEADWTLESRLETALASVGLPLPPATSLASLSGGQRTRASLAAAIFVQPDFLLFDEPSNNLDREGREALIALLRGWRGGAIVVSHDRELLDQMDAIVELTSLGATRYGGNFNAYRERKMIELEAARRDLAAAERRIDEVSRAAQAAIERQARSDGVGNRKAAKGGMPRILIGQRKQQAEESGGAAARLAERQRAEAGEAAGAARARLEVLEPIKVSLPPTGLAAGQTVLRVDCVTAGYARARPVIKGFDLSIVGPERIAITGPNGSGKSTVLALVTGMLTPWAGKVSRPLGCTVLDQRVSLLDRNLSIADNFSLLHPAATINACRAALARFRFRAEAADQLVGSLSGGQMLRAGLACVLGGEVPPPLLILDEPTNHLDLDSIAAVEAGVAAYDGALLVVSHDEAFLANIGITRRIELQAKLF